MDFTIDKKEEGFGRAYKSFSKDFSNIVLNNKTYMTKELQEQEFQKAEKNNITKAETFVTIAKYKRCSTDNQELTLQDEILEKKILQMKEKNPNVEYRVLDYSDFAFSGKSTQRPALKKLLEDVEKGKIDIVIFTKLDRLARSLQDLLFISQKFSDKGVKFIVVEQEIDTSTYQGRLLFQILGAFAEFERNIIRERMELGRKKAEKLGTKSGKPCHRPKKQIDVDGVLFKHLNQKLSLRQIAKIYGCSITPIRRIIKENEEKIKK